MRVDPKLMREVIVSSVVRRFLRAKMQRLYELQLEAQTVILHSKGKLKLMAILAEGKIIDQQLAIIMRQGVNDETGRRLAAGSAGPLVQVNILEVNGGLGRNLRSGFILIDGGESSLLAGEAITEVSPLTNGHGSNGHGQRRN